MKCIQAPSVAALAALTFVLLATRPGQAQDSPWFVEATKLLPVDAAAVFAVEFEAARSSPLYQRFESSVLSRRARDLDRVAALSGFDLRRDVHGMLAAIWVAPDRGDSAFLAVLRGHFQLSDEGHAMLDELSPSSGEHRGIAVRTLPSSDNSAGEKRCFAILSESMALFGNRAAVVAAIERSFADGPSVRDNNLLAALSDEASRSAQLWFVSDDPSQVISAAPESLEKGAGRLLAIFRIMRETKLTADLVDGLDFHWSSQLSSPATARAFADALGGMVAAARANLPSDDTQQAILLDRLRVDSALTGVDVRLSMTKAELENLLDANGSTSDAAEAR